MVRIDIVIKDKHCTNNTAPRWLVSTAPKGLGNVCLCVCVPLAGRSIYWWHEQAQKAVSDTKTTVKQQPSGQQLLLAIGEDI